METLQKIEQFKGKRNCALTLFIPPNYDFTKDIKRIYTSIISIKHEQKKKQLLPIIKTIKSHIDDKKIIGFGQIICCGLGQTLVYYQLNPRNLIQKFEYYYDYVFSTNMIKKFLFPNISYIVSNKTVVQRLNVYMLKDNLCL